MKYKLYGKTGYKQPILIDQSNNLQFLVDQAEYFLLKALRYDTCYIKNERNKDVWYSDIDMMKYKIPAITEVEDLIKIECEEKYNEPDGT